MILKTVGKLCANSACFAMAALWIKEKYATTADAWCLQGPLCYDGELIYIYNVIYLFSSNYEKIINYNCYSKA